MAKPTRKRSAPAKEAPAAALEAALAYAAQGWSVVPVAPRAKRPIVRWEPYQHEAADEARLKRWFARWPDANIAVVTGEVSGLVVLDVDPKHGGERALAALEARHGPLPTSVEAVTGGGGRHVYFAHPGREVRNRTGLAPGIDLRGDGGVIVVPPSLHPSGRRYRWKRGRAPDDLPLAPLPVWLELDRWMGGEAPRGQPLAHWRALAREGVKEGRRNSTIASFTGHLLWHGVDPDVVTELMLAWNAQRCDPPLGDEEVAETVRSIERTHRRQAAAVKPGRGTP